MTLKETPCGRGLPPPCGKDNAQDGHRDQKTDHLRDQSIVAGFKEGIIYSLQTALCFIGRLPQAKWVAQALNGSGEGLPPQLDTFFSQPIFALCDFGHSWKPYHRGSLSMMMVVKN